MPRGNCNHYFNYFQQLFLVPVHRDLECSLNKAVLKKSGFKLCFFGLKMALILVQILAES